MVRVAWCAALFVLLVGGILGGFRVVATEQEPPTQLVISPDVQTRLRVLAAGMHIEIGMCLLGYVDGDTSFITDLYMPTPFRATAKRSSSGACPDRTRAFFHLHPGIWISVPSVACVEAFDRAGLCEGSMVHIVSNPPGFCAMSTQDRKTATRLGYPFQLIATSPTVFCWWTLEQASRDTLDVLLPIPGQASWLPDTK